MLVTFNGKSFDWPLLETRYRMTRKIRAPAPRAHLDFLHPARNLWRLAARIGSSVGTRTTRARLESRRGRDVRTDPVDLFRLSARRTAEPLIPIFLTTKWTCADLPHLSSRLFRCSPIRRNQGWSRAFRSFANLRTPRRNDARARLTHSRWRRNCRWKAIGWREARWHGWQNAKATSRSRASFGPTMLGSSREGLEAYEQLAIHYERHPREPDRAALISRRTLSATFKTRSVRRHRFRRLSAGYGRDSSASGKARAKGGRTLLAAKTIVPESPARWLANPI